MKIFNPKAKLECPYCSEKSEYPASDYVKPLSNAVHKELCHSCDQEYLVCRKKDGMIAVDSNWTEARLYAD